MASHFTVDGLPLGRWPTREIHLENQWASEGILEGGGPKGEFHRTVLMSAGTSLMRTETAREETTASLPVSDGFLNRVVFAAVFFTNSVPDNEKAENS